MAKLKRFGGTPVAEGIRLEVGKYTVFSVRNRQRDISVRMRREPRRALRSLFRIPFVRGVVRVFRDVFRFFDGLSESAELQPQQVQLKGNLMPTFHSQGAAALFTFILTIIICAVCLWAAPLGAAMMAKRFISSPRIAVNASVCAVRIVCFWFAIWLCGNLPLINRLRMYRGAFAKVLNCYECRDELSAENAAGYPLITRRSECAFLILTLTVSMIICACIHPAGAILTALIRIAVFFLTAAILNEPLLWLEDSDPTFSIRIVRGPVDLFQRMTTAEPSAQMLEVALCAFSAVLDSPEEEESA